MDSNGRKTGAAHYDGVFPGDLRAGGYLAEWNHPSCDRAPDLQAVKRIDITAFGKRRTGDNR